MAFPRPGPRPELPRRRVRTVECGQGGCRAVRFNVDGNYCLTCGSDKTLKLWNPHKGTALRTYQGHGYEVLDAAGSFDNSQICSCGADKTVVLWDVATGQAVRKYQGTRGKVNCVQFNDEATVIVSGKGAVWGGPENTRAPRRPQFPTPPTPHSPPPGSIDSTVRCWDCRSRRPDPVQILDEAKDGVSSVKLSDHEILSGEGRGHAGGDRDVPGGGTGPAGPPRALTPPLRSSVDGRVRRYDLRAGQLYSDYVGSPITSVCFSKDGQCALAASLDSTLRLLDKDGELLGEYTGHRSTAYRLDCVLSEQDTRGSASEDGHVYFWEPGGGSLALKLEVGRGVVQSLAFHPSLPCLLAAAQGHIQLWREDSFQPEGDSAP
ncbi:LOW QUALITY PROTEIN: WD repeat domain-containing protein 83 [Pterocles gutturalis]